MAVKGMAASAIAHGELTHKTAINTPINSMPKVAGQVLRLARHQVIRSGIADARPTIAAVNALLARKNTNTAAITPGTAVTSPRLAGPRKNCDTSPPLAAIKTYCPTLYSRLNQTDRFPPAMPTAATTTAQ